MKHEDFLKLITFAKIGEDLVPVSNHTDLINELIEGQTVFLKLVNTRDIAMHRCYFAILRYIYRCLPPAFTNKIKIAKFYKWIQTLKKDYDVLFEFSDGTRLLDYNSISFANMNEFDFTNYIKDQLPFIYENIIRPFYNNDESYNNIINCIEDEFSIYLAKLFK